MKLSPSRSLKEVAAVIGAEYQGSEDHQVSGFNEIHRVEKGDLTFVDIPKYFSKSLNSKASTILINEKVKAPLGKALIFSDDPFRDFNKLTEFYRPASLPVSHTATTFHHSVEIGQHVAIGHNVCIGKNSCIGHHVAIGDNVNIGENTIIYPNVSIYSYTDIGSHVTIHSGAVIGSEAFYYKNRPEGRDKLLSKGGTLIANHVDIGAGTTIDRGVSALTAIGEHTKIDNLVQIGHDTTIGKRCLIAAQSGIAGVCQIEDDVIIWGQVGIASNVRIGKKAVLLAKTGVMSDLEGGKTYLGMVAKEYKKKWREILCLEQLPDLLDQLKQKK